MIKKLFSKKESSKSLTIVFLNVKKKTIELVTFSDMFDFFNYCEENDIKTYKTHCYDPKKSSLLITYNDSD